MWRGIVFVLAWLGLVSTRVAAGGSQRGLLVGRSGAERADCLALRTREAGRVFRTKTLEPRLWRGRTVKLVQGTGISMPVTPEIQAVYLQLSTQVRGSDSHWRAWSW